MKHKDYSGRKADCAGNAEILVQVKVTTAVRIVDCKLPHNAVDDYMKISETAAPFALKRFCSAILETVRPAHLCAPSGEYIKKVLHEQDGCDIPGFPGKIHCSKWG